MTGLEEFHFFMGKFGKQMVMKQTFELKVFTLGAISVERGSDQVESKEDFLKKLIVNEFFLRSISNFQLGALGKIPTILILAIDVDWTSQKLKLEIQRQGEGGGGQMSAECLQTSPLTP